MPSVATAATATAAQTQAAGSRMMGYYLGGGGVKVDCLFDTANFVTKDADGKVGAIHIKSSAELMRLETTTARGSGQCYQTFADPTGTKGHLGWSSTSDQLDVRNSLNAPCVFWTNGSDRWQIGASGNFEPRADNTYQIGYGAARPSVIFAATGSINTSDEREKTWRGAPTAAELAAAKRIASELGFYQWNDAITEKGEDGARLHFGVRAQAVWAIMADEGLIDPIVEGEAPSSRYAFLCYDAWLAIGAVAEERDEEGNITVAAVEAREAGNRFGIRPDQLTLFLIAAQEARLAALEAA